MQRFLPSRVWKPAPLPVEFHIALDSGDWVGALKRYQMHPFHAPPLDTYELLKTIVFKTGLKLDSVKQRFDTKARLTASTRRKVPEQVDWHVFWEALNKGDARNISNALLGARVSTAPSQIAVAEACAVLLQSQGSRWHAVLVDMSPFSAVTINNLLTTAVQVGRWDLSIEMMRNVRIGKNEAHSLWHGYYNRAHWTVGLAFVMSVPRQHVEFDEVLPTLLDAGCSLPLLAEHLESHQALSDAGVIAPLMRVAFRRGEYVFVMRCLEHLVEIGTISPAAFRMVGYLCERHGNEKVLMRIDAAGIQFHELTVELLEEVRL